MAMNVFWQIADVREGMLLERGCVHGVGQSADNKLEVRALEGEGAATCPGAAQMGKQSDSQVHIAIHITII